MSFEPLSAISLFHEKVRHTVFDVSVIIPTYNRLWSLPEAIGSCRGSSCNVEIIVVDDGSTDGTWEWLQKLDGVVCLRQENLGKCYAVNRGFQIARGEYVRFLDSDDLLPEYANEIQLSTGRAAGADVVVAGYTSWFERTGSEHTRSWVHCDDFLAQQIGETDSSHYSAYLFRREFIQSVPHRQEFAHRDDRMFVIEVALLDPKVATVEAPCLIHRHHLKDRIQFRSGLTSVVTNWQEREMFRRVERMLVDRGMLTGRRQNAIAKSLWPLARRVAATHLGEARQLLKAIHRLNPEFSIDDKSAIGVSYRIFGFTLTECAIRLARMARDGLRLILRRDSPYSPPSP